MYDLKELKTYVKRDEVTGNLINVDLTMDEFSWLLKQDKPTLSKEELEYAGRDLLRWNNLNINHPDDRYQRSLLAKTKLKLLIKNYSVFNLDIT